MNKMVLPVLILLTLAACSVPVDAPPLPTALPSDTPQPTVFVPLTFTPIPLLTQVATQPPTSSPPLTPYPFCDDPRARELILSFSKAIANKDGALLSSLVSPATGMDVRFYRDGNVVKYDVEHAKFVFETTFRADWGLSFGSGEPTLGSFQEIILPSLQKVFTSSAVLVCNQIKVGGANYQALWPYEGMNYYSVHFPGTEANGGLDWETWAVGMESSTGRPMLAALVHFVWEP
jgi:hypothetical protein